MHRGRARGKVSSPAHGDGCPGAQHAGGWPCSHLPVPLMSSIMGTTACPGHLFRKSHRARQGKALCSQADLCPPGIQWSLMLNQVRGCPMLGIYWWSMYPHASRECLLLCQGAQVPGQSPQTQGGQVESQHLESIKQQNPFPRAEICEFNSCRINFFLLYKSQTANWYQPALF